MAKNISIIGTGYVGLVTGTCFAEIGHKVICVDNNPDKITALKAGRIPIYEPGLEKLVQKNVRAGRLSFTTDIREAVRASEVIFIAVHTPPREDGSGDLSFVEAVARTVAEHMPSYRLIVEKSTVPVETGQWVKRTVERFNKRKVPFDVASNPEFLREGSAIQDFLHPDRIVIGVSSKKAEKIMRELYKPVRAPVLVTDISSAEMIKHASNSFLAMKISYINAVANVCEKSGADVLKVAEGMGYDARIGKSFLQAGLGYGGSCFPKDVSAFVWISGKLGYDFQMLKAVQAVNDQQRQLLVKKVEESVWNLQGKTIGLLGIAFKPNTDDIRNAPALDIIPLLTAKGAKVKAYDPVAMENAKKALKDVEMTSDAYGTAKDADALVVVTEWPEFKKLSWPKIKKLMKQPVIVDGRNFLDPIAMKKMGFAYKGVGRCIS